MRRGPPSSGFRVVFGMSWRRNAIESSPHLRVLGVTDNVRLLEPNWLGAGGRHLPRTPLGIDLVRRAALARAAALGRAAGDQLVEHRLRPLRTEHTTEALNVLTRRG